MGGNPTDPRNLWPEPYPRASQMDQIENQLNSEICDGQLTLAQAQEKRTRSSTRRGRVASMEIAPDAHMGLVELSVSDLDRSLAYWQDAIGLRVLSRENGTAELGVDVPLVRFVEEPGATPAQGYTGLFHVALLVPDRASLGSVPRPRRARSDRAHRPVRPRRERGDLPPRP